MTLLRELENWMSPAVVRVLGYALLHSLWQGAALAGLLAAALPLLRRTRPEVRYGASAAALAGLLLAVAGTLAYYAQHPATPAGPVGNGAISYQVILVQGPGRPAAPGLLPTLARAAEPYLPALVAAWLLGLLLMGGRLAGGVAVASRLRRAGVQALGAGWQQRLAALATRAGLRRPVALLESARVSGPLVLGHLRPVILLPLGAVAGLPPALLEALLAHELAHIVRRDYLLNLALAAVEVLFFYHPAVWFIAASLRAERENCCDDRAAALCGGDRLRVAHALAALAELEAATPRLALAAAGTGGRGSLLARVRRLALGHTQVPTVRERLLAGLLCLLGVAGLGTSLALAAPVPGTRHPAALPPVAPPASPADTTKRSRAKTTTTVTTRTDSPLPAGLVDSVVTITTAITVPPDTPRLGRELRDIRIRREGPVSGRPPRTVVIEKDKKGRLENLLIDGQPVPIEQSGKKARRRKKQEVEIVEVPAPDPTWSIAPSNNWRMTPGSTWNAAPGNAWRVAPGSTWNAGPNSAWNVGPGPTWELVPQGDAATDARRQARRGLADALRNRRDLTPTQRRAIEQAQRSLEDGRDDEDERPRPRYRIEKRGGGYQLLPVPRRSAAASSPYRLLTVPRQSDPIIKYRVETDTDGQLHRYYYETPGLATDLAQTRRDQLQAFREQAQAQREAAQALREQAQAQRQSDVDAARRLGEASQRLTEAGARLGARASRLGADARRTELEARIAAAEAELSALDAEAEAVPRAPRLPRVPQAPRAPRLQQVLRVPQAPLAPLGQTAPLPPPPPAPGPPVPPPPPPANTAAVRDELRRDGLIGKTDRSFSLHLGKDGGRVNGRALTAEQARKYRRLLGHTDDQDETELRMELREK